MIQITTDRQFDKDYLKLKKNHPELIAELRTAINLLAEKGELPEIYGPHTLDKLDAKYSGHIDFHLAEGKSDVIVLYLPHKTNPRIRLVRVGSHEEIFGGKEK